MLPNNHYGYDLDKGDFVRNYENNFSFSEIIKGIRYKYGDGDKTEKEEFIKKSVDEDGFGCSIDVLIKRTKWTFGSKENIEATYTEERILHPTSRQAVTPREKDGNACMHDNDFLVISDRHVVDEVSVLDKQVKEEAEKQEKLDEIQEMSKNTEDL